MMQRAVTIVVPLQHDVAGEVRCKLRGLEAAGSMLAGLPSLHFACWFVLDAHTDVNQNVHPPLLILEANFDGKRCTFLEGLVERQRSVLDTIYDGAIGYPGSAASASDVVAYLRRHDRGAHLFYVGCPGKTVAQIGADAALRPDLQRRARALAAHVDRRTQCVEGVWRGLPAEEKALPEQPFWVRHTLRRGILRGLFGIVRWPLFAGGIVAALVALAGAVSPWAVPAALAQIASDVLRAIACGFVLSSALWGGLLLANAPQRVRPGVWLRTLAGQLWRFATAALWLAPLALAACGLVSLALWQCGALRVGAAALSALLLLAALLAAAALLGIARREQTDEVLDLEYAPGRQLLRQRENRAPQNHFICLHEIKPGWLRMLTLRFVLAFLQLAVRVYYNLGDLGGIASIHFGRWIVLRERRQLLFATNFDGSWNGYLGEFVNRASTGVNSIWTNTRLFPRTHFLVGDGCRDEQRFKCWARSGEVETLYWLRSYEHSVAAIVRNDALRRELASFGERLERGRAISEAELDAWLRRL